METMVNAQAQIEFVIGCTVLIAVYGFAVFLLYKEWRDNYKFDVSKLSFKPEDKEEYDKS